jgi:hypothetical protein
MRQIGPLFGILHAAAHRVIDTVGPLLALAPPCRRPADAVGIVDDTLVPAPDPQAHDQTCSFAAGRLARAVGRV